VIQNVSLHIAQVSSFQQETIGQYEKSDIIARFPLHSIICSEFPDIFHQQKKSNHLTNSTCAITDSHATISLDLACIQH